MSDTQTTFTIRKRLLTVRSDAMAVASDIRARLAPDQTDALRALLYGYHPADLADALLFLSPEEDKRVFDLLDAGEAAAVLDEVDAETEANLVRGVAPARLAAILQWLPADEGADVVGALARDVAEQTLAAMDRDSAQEIRALLHYPADTAGGIMSIGFVDVREDATQADALKRFQEKTEAEHIFYVYAVDADGRLKGSVDLRRLLSAESTALIRDLMQTEVIAVPPDCDQEQVARIFARYDLTALPVVDSEPDGRLIGVITSDDVIDVIQEE